MKDHNKLNDLSNSLEDEMGEIATKVTRMSVSTEVGADGIDASVSANVELTGDAIALGGSVAALEWVAQAIEEQFERNLDDYERRNARGVEELAETRKEDLYENCRIMAYIDKDRRDEMVETLRERGL